jgi:uncharacterized protein
MEVLLGQLAQDGERFVGEEPPEVLDLAPDEAVVSVGPVKYDLTVREVQGRELLVQGKVWCESRLRCSRCAGVFDAEVAEDPYIRSYELSDETESVDLTPDMREATLLAFPAYPVCKSECRGLCLTCGKRLNDGPCECQPAGNIRWGSLDALKLD